MSPANTKRNVRMHGGVTSGTGGKAGNRGTSGALSSRTGALSAMGKRGATAPAAGFGAHFQRPSTTQPSLSSRSRKAVPILAIEKLKQTPTPSRLDG